MSNTPGKIVLRSNGKRGLLVNGKLALYNSSGTCPACCAGVIYQLVDCASVADTIYTATGLSDYVNSVGGKGPIVRIAGSVICYTASVASGTHFLQSVSITASYTTCEVCGAPRDCADCLAAGLMPSAYTVTFSGLTNPSGYAPWQDVALINGQTAVFVPTGAYCDYTPIVRLGCTRGSVYHPEGPYTTYWTAWSFAWWNGSLVIGVEAGWSWSTTMHEEEWAACEDWPSPPGLVAAFSGIEPDPNFETCGWFPGYGNSGSLTNDLTDYGGTASISIT